MRLLLDTCTFLWLIWNEAPLHDRARAWLGDPDNEVFVSAVSIWEAVNKHRIGKLTLNTQEPSWQHFTRLRELHQVAPLQLAEADVRHLSNIPVIHRDPFDLLLICQSIEHGLTLVTPDKNIRRYPIRTLW